VHRGLARTPARVERLLRQYLEPACLDPTQSLSVRVSPSQFDPDADVAPGVEVTLPHRWGPAWHTTWFHLAGTVPTAWAGRRVVAHIDLGFRGRGEGFQAEALVWQDGRLRHAVQPDRRTVVVADPASGGDVIDLQIEAVSNPTLFDDPSGVPHRPTALGDPLTAHDRPLYVMRCAELAVEQPEVMALCRELRLVLDLAGDLEPTEPRSARLERVLEDAIAAVDLADVVGTASRARAVVASTLALRGTPHRHRVVAVGHAHLDTAWLWPVREARRKARRTFANAVELAERYPDYRFAHSQAQHWAWIAQDDPELFERVTQLVAAGRMEPVGGMWVEADLNSSGGESLVRQLLHGQHAFHQWFGTWCSVGFLPDDFGYPATLPQLFTKAGCMGFFTQKLSWNETNRFPHHTFWWEGLDGSRVLTHFSPVDTYNAVMMPSQLRFGERHFSDHGVSDRSLMCFGHGDGGGGPTAEMLERARLMVDWDGVPIVEMNTVASYFEAVTANTPARGSFDTWVGDIVLEKHRGTFTSQVATKQGNVASELGLRAAEWWTLATGIDAGEALRDLWTQVLVQQFHDILPGSSIAWVHREAEAVHHRVAQAVRGWLDTSLGTVTPGDPSTEWCVANSAPVALDAVVVVTAIAQADPGDVVQCLTDGTWAVHVAVPALSSMPWHQAVQAGTTPVTLSVDGDGAILMDNGRLRVVVGTDGRVVELVALDPNGSTRQVLTSQGGGARMVLHRDQPGEYDAWDIDEPDARRPPDEVPVAQRVEVVENGPLLARVRCTHQVGTTTLVHHITVTAGAARVDHRLDAQWHESERRLSFVVPVDVAGTHSVAGVQFGHVARARHRNTSWQAAHFEQVAHRFVHVGETRFGVALLFAGSRGVDLNHPSRHLGVSLLRSPRYPDPHSDRGARTVSWSVAITHGEVWGDGMTAGLEVEAQRHQHPPRLVKRAVEPLVRHDLRGVMVDTLKAPHISEGSCDTVILRLWESEGARCEGTLTVTLPGRGVLEAVVCDLLERPITRATVNDDGSLPLTMAPFEVKTLRLRMPSTTPPN
jgi:alpha-mannosidase